jgi:hypothetical protein
MADARGGRDRRNRRARLDILAERPGPLFGALGELQIASPAATLKAGAPIATTSSISK